MKPINRAPHGILRSGTRIAGYEVVEICGQGAMAITYRAVRCADGRAVALKIPRPRCLRDPAFVVRFLQEANLGSRLRNRFVARVYEGGEYNGLPYLAMEYLEGMTLKQALEASGRIQPRRAMELAHDAASALEHAHAAGVVHRDLKPDNIMLRVGTCLKVMDFGVAKMMGEVGLTTSNLFLGSPLYAAPEMLDAASVDHRVDLYSLGVILYEMLQGEPPFDGPSPVEVLLKHKTEALPPIDDLPQKVSPALWGLVVRLTAKDPDDRLPDARAVQLAIELML